MVMEAMKMKLVFFLKAQSLCMNLGVETILIFEN